MIRLIKILFLLSICFLSVQLKAQERTVDALKKDLQQAKHDTTRCRILLEMVIAEGDENLWPGYNEQLLKLSQRKASETKSKKLKKIYLKHMADAINNVGYLADVQGEIFRAINYYKKSLEIYRKINDKQGIATAYNNIGFIYDNQGDIQNALEYYHNSLLIREQIRDYKGVASTLNNIGYVYSFQGDVSKALENHQKALRINKKIKNDKGIANSLLNLGVNYSKMGDLSKALQCYEQALKIQKKINNVLGVANSLNNIGSICEKQGKIDKAFDYFQQSVKIFKKINDKKGTAKSLNSIAIVLLKQGKSNEALAYAGESMEIANNLGYPEDIESAASTFKKIYFKLKKHEQAYKMLELEILMRDSINNQLTKKASIKKQYQYEYETKAAADSVKNAEAQKVENALFAAQKAELEQEKTQRYALYGGLALVILFALFVWSRFKLTSRQKGIIEQQKLIVEAHQQEILDSITYAKRLQDAILSPIDFIKENTDDFFVLYKPKDIVAGDFYWAEKVDNYFFVAAADCTGHGVPGAMVSMVCCNALNRTVNEFGITDTGAILDNVKMLVLDVFKKSGETINDGMDISLCRIDQLTKEVQWSGANNPLWYVQNGELKNIRADKQHIGKTDVSSPFTSHLLPKSDDTTLYLFTDGLADQFGGPHGKKFKIKQFCDMILKNSKLKLQQQADVFDEVFLEWKGELEQVDDVCVIGIKI